MITVSDKYKKAIKNEVRELNAYVEMIVNGGYIGAFWDDRVIPIENRVQIVGSNPSELATDYSNYSVADSSSVVYNYASLERDYFLLDGSFILPNRSAIVGRKRNENTGYIGGIGQDTLTLSTFTNSYLVKNKNITIYFNQEYPVNMAITFTCLYHSSEQEAYITRTYSESFTNNTKLNITTDSSIIAEEVIEDGYVYKYYGINSFSINVTEWSNPLHRVRIGQINAGETVVYKDNDIIEIKLNEQTSLDNTDTPDNDCAITLNNFDRKFNIVDESNILNRFTKNSTIKTFVAVKVDGNFEYLDTGTYQYESYTDNNNLDITINGRGYIQDLENEMPITSNYNKTVKELALQIFVNGIIANINDVYYNGYINMPDTNFDSKREQAQALTIFSNNILKQFRNGENGRNFSAGGFEKGFVYLAKKNFEFNDTIELTQELEFPKFNKRGVVKNITFINKKLGNLNNDETTIFEDDVTPIFDSQTGKYYIQGNVDLYNPVSLGSIKYYIDDVQVSSSSGSGYTYRLGYSTEVSDSSTKKLKIVGKEYNAIDITKTIVNDSIEQGAYLEYNNNYINADFHRYRISDYVFRDNNTYEFQVEILGDPSLEVGDNILLENFDGYKQGNIESIESTYNGGFTSIIKGVCSNVL